MAAAATMSARGTAPPAQPQLDAEERPRSFTAFSNALWDASHSPTRMSGVAAARMLMAAKASGCSDSSALSHLDDKVLMTAVAADPSRLPFDELKNHESGFALSAVMLAAKADIPLSCALPAAEVRWLMQTVMEMPPGMLAQGRAYAATHTLAKSEAATPVTQVPNYASFTVTRAGHVEGREVGTSLQGAQDPYLVAALSVGCPTAVSTVTPSQDASKGTTAFDFVCAKGTEVGGLDIATQLETFLDNAKDHMRQAGATFTGRGDGTPGGFVASMDLGKADAQTIVEAVTYTTFQLRSALSPYCAHKAAVLQSFEFWYHPDKSTDALLKTHFACPA